MSLGLDSLPVCTVHAAVNITTGHASLAHVQDDSDALGCVGGWPCAAVAHHASRPAPLPTLAVAVRAVLLL